MKKILIDTDPGIDDAQAICYAIAHPQLEVIGLSCIFGNVSSQLATENAYRLCHLIGVTIPIAKGATDPLEIEAHPVADFVHGSNGLGNVDLPLPKITGKPQITAAEFIIDTIKSNPGEVSLIPIGPLTNIAMALYKAPEITELVAEVIVMGGAFQCNGNVSPNAEANIWNDPHAAQRVLTADWPLTVHGLDVTYQMTFSPTYLNALAQASPKCGTFLRDASEFYSNFYRQQNNLDGCCPHDLLAVAYAANPNWYETMPADFDVVTQGTTIGQTIFTPNSKSNKKFATKVAADNLLTEYQQVLSLLP